MSEFADGWRAWWGAFDNNWPYFAGLLTAATVMRMVTDVVIVTAKHLWLAFR